MEGSKITRDIGRPRKTIWETTKKDKEINEWDRDMVYDRILWRNFIHVADPVHT